MAQVLQLRRGTTAQNDTFTGAAGEVTVDTDRKSLRVHDGSTMGGKEIADLATAIPLLTDATTVNAADELVIQQGGITKRATGAELAKGLNTINGTVNVKDFGAVGDGVADDTAAIQAALNASIEKVLCIPKGTYRCDSPLVGGTGVHIVAESGATLDFSQRASHLTEQDSGLLVFRGIAASEVLLTADATLGDKTIAVASASGLSVGDMLEVSMNAEGSFVDSSIACKSGQLNIITAISGTTITLDTDIYDTLSVANGARVRKITPVENVCVQGVTIKGKGRPQPSGNGDVGLSIFHGKNVSVKDCRFVQIDQRSCNIIGCLGFIIENNYVYHDPKGTSNTVNYGITYSSSQWGVIRSNRCVNQRHAIVSSHLSSTLTNKYYGISRHIIIEGNAISNNWHGGIATHNDAEFVQIIGNTISGCQFGINARDKNKEIANNTIYGCVQAIYLSGRATRITVTGNMISGCGNALVMDKVATGVPVVNLHITNNTITNCTAGGVTCNDDSPGQIMPGLLISGNNFSNINGTGNAACVRIQGSYAGIVANNVFYDSNIVGARLDAGTAMVINGNHFYNVHLPIDVEASPDYTIIYGNVFANYGAATPIQLSSPSNASISGNVDLETI